ncbi:hypothetical protein [Streptomyces sp. NPDC007883]|uniref:hypothetical protein n=1 Tax=Streptomyces sp. NPDC007883 TaxID=3155116 RepID=UPI0033F5A749
MDIGKEHHHCVVIDARRTFAFAAATVQAAIAVDFPLPAAPATPVTAVVLLGNLLAELLHGLLAPP